jgi:hypothetical protein
MDDYSMASLQESRNEWCARLVHILTPLIIQGFRSIFKEANILCVENDESDKYLMTFQNFLSRVPKWNATIIETETKRIVDHSKCGYLEDLITCVHIIQLKSLTCMRVGNTHKKVDINIPQLNEFIHKVYINVARKLYTNVYLFEQNIMPLNIQRNNRELEIMTKECILGTIRDNIPVEEILKVYMDESVEEDVQVEEKEEIVSEEPIIDESEVESSTDAGSTNTGSTNAASTNAASTNAASTNTGIVPTQHADSAPVPNIQFNDVDKAIDTNRNISDIVAPKTIERLESISVENHQRRKDDEDEDEEEKIKIGTEINLTDLDIHSVVPAPTELKKEDVWNEIEILPLE